MTRDEFAEGYAARSGTTVARLKELGREAAPCDCGESNCEDWQMAFRNLLEQDEQAVGRDRMLPCDLETLDWLRANEARLQPAAEQVQQED